MEKDYYHILGISPGAETKEIKEAYRKLAFSHHPDRNKDQPEAAERMKAVNEAYAVLSDPTKRREYDSLRQQFGSSSAYNQFRQTHSDQDIFRGSDVNQMFEEIAKSFGLRGFDDIFKEFYGQGYHSFEFKGGGFFGRGFIFSGYFDGKSKGSAGPSLAGGFFGKVGRFLTEKVIRAALPQTGSDMNDGIVLSPEQAKEGGPYAYFHKKRGKRLVVTLPPGVRDGQRIRLAGMGEASSGGSPGDLYLKVEIKKPFLQKVQDFISGPSADGP